MSKNTSSDFDLSTLTEIHTNEQQVTEDLREKLLKIRKDNVELEADLKTRSQAYEETMGQLQQLKSSKSSQYLEKLMAVDNLVELKEQIIKLHEKYLQQQGEIKKLEFELEMEHGHVNILKHENKVLRQTAVEMSAMAEQEEEYISNKLFKKISGLKKEKGDLLLQVEQEEEYMTNMLQKKLNQLQREKIDMENSLEHEQEYIVNRLQKQLEALQTTSPLMENTSAPISPIISYRSKKRNLSSGSINEIQSNAAEALLSEIAVLKNRTTEMEKEFLLKMQQCNKYKSELIQHRKQAGESVEDITLDEGIPAVFRTIPPSPGRSGRIYRSASSSSQISLLSDKNNIPPLQLDDNPVLFNSSGPEPINRSRSNSITSHPLAPRSTRRVSGTLLSLAASGPTTSL